MRAAEFFSTTEGQKYLNIFKDKIFVIKYGGAALESEEMMPYFLEDIAEMFLHGIKIILVHGGGKKLSQKMEEKNIPVVFENGLRKTTEETVLLAKEVFAELNQSICSVLKQFKVPPLSLADSRLILAKLENEENPENKVGIVEQIITEKINFQYIPVVSSIGHYFTDNKINYLNINADHLAVDIARALTARKVIFISDVNGIYLDPQKPETKISHITESEIKKLINDNILTGGMKLKIEMALEALKGGINKVHFIDGRIEHSVMLEIFTDKGIGTEIVHD
ncbi:MAG: acetylglutamate kinase [Spirochaetia bacterium]|nr:acetylglutamate kinase [Spirochaetia bacterium]